MERLQEIADGVWGVEHELRFLGMLFNTRMTVMRLEGGELLLHSPVPIDDELAAAIDALGEVAHVVGPSRLHHLYLPQAQARYPRAALWGSAGLLEKRADLSFDGALDSLEAPGSWGSGVEVVPVNGAPAMGEVVLYHRPSASLVVTDLLMNIPPGLSPLTDLVMWIEGCRGRLKQPRMWWLVTRDREAMRRSSAALLERPVARVIPGHGAVVEEDASAAVRRALIWGPEQQSLPKSTSG